MAIQSARETLADRAVSGVPVTVGLQSPGQNFVVRRGRLGYGAGLAAGAALGGSAVLLRRGLDDRREKKRKRRRFSNGSDLVEFRRTRRDKGRRRTAKKILTGLGATGLLAGAGGLYLARKRRQAVTPMTKNLLTGSNQKPFFPTKAAPRPLDASMRQSALETIQRNTPAGLLGLGSIGAGTYLATKGAVRSMVPRSKKRKKRR